MTISSATNLKACTYEVTSESDIGIPTIYDRKIIIPLGIGPWAAGSRIYAIDTKSTWLVVDSGLGTTAAVLLSQASLFSPFTLGQPRIRVLTNRLHIGATRTGVPANAYGEIIVSTEDVPNILLTDPAYRFQLELVRYVPKRRKFTETAPGSMGYVPQPAGFYHPTSLVGGATPAPIAGTRSGAQNGVATNRQTEWPLTGFLQEQKLTLNAADMILPYFEIKQVGDFAGATTNALIYFISNKRTSPRGVISYKQSPFLGVFRFRYAAYDIINQRMVVGPYSDTIYARPQKWPTIVDPADLVRRKRLINAVPVIDPNTGVSCFEQLTISVGGRIAGRQF